ncbi:MAG: GNAT family N-acetyltransferase [candidate division WOR-3 bacterium]|nr:MAG: GNAT family N-acetyltransferase [candidate division WOR-3 bacterium]
MEIKYLKDYKEWIPTIAKWFYDEWGHLYPELDIDKIILRLHKRTNVDIIPLALVALENRAVIGTASLKKFDMDTRMQYSPWLASVYVSEKWRGKGIGTSLVRAIEEKAKEIGVKILYLYTPDAQNFYAKLGWRELESTEYRGQDVTIMIKNL